LFSLALAPTILIWFVVGSLFFGYRPVGIQGTSMEPALLDGDELWVKYLEPAEVKVGDIVVLQDPALGQIAHRLVSVEPLLNGSYLVVTKGDANHYAEEWEMGPGSKMGVALVRVRFAGQVFRFLKTPVGIALLVVSAVAMSVALWMAHRRRLAHGGG
jgi:signal peptidase